MQRVRMYDLHERAWHWVQAGVILLLFWTGAVVHRPDLPLLLDFRFAEFLHRWAGLALALNALLGLLYHIFSREILQFLPDDPGFFGLALRQARYYTGGIFRGEDHPVEKTRQAKLNPLQKLTYLALLNIALPGQVFSGLLLWSGHAGLRGMLPPTWIGLLASLHLLLAWMLLVFLVSHIYLATTGHTPASNFVAMITGYEDLPQGHAEGAER